MRVRSASDRAAATAAAAAGALVDDGRSTEDAYWDLVTADIVEAEYSDAVRLIRNPQRLGLTGNWQKALSSGTGEIRALLHMDD